MIKIVVFIDYIDIAQRDGSYKKKVMCKLTTLFHI